MQGRSVKQEHTNYGIAEGLLTAKINLPAAIRFGKPHLTATEAVLEDVGVNGLLAQGMCGGG